jgi:hypothetical protein
MLFSNLHTARKPNELTRATNKLNRVNLFICFVNKLSWLIILTSRTKPGRVRGLRMDKGLMDMVEGNKEVKKKRGEKE